MLRYWGSAKLKFRRAKNIIYLPDRSAIPVREARPQPRKKTQRPSIISLLSLREKFLTLSLFAVSTFSVMQIAIAQNSYIKPEMVQYSDARELWSERSQDNFPGSAFYFLDESNGDWIDPVVQQASIGANGGQGAPSLTADINAQAPLGSAQFGTGASAGKFRLTGLTNSQYRAQQCLTTAIYYEAALEPDAGQRAVAQVILNRVAHPSYPKSVCGVVYQGSERSTGCQFSFTCDGSLRRKPNGFYWKRARKVATAMLAGEVSIPAGLATHYHTSDIRPYWAPSLNFLGTIGNHRFYKWRGAAGKKSAFSQRYSGSEPLPGPYLRKVAAGKAKAADPVALAKSYEDAMALSKQAQNTAPKAESNASAASARQPALNAQPPVRNDAIGKAANSGDVLPQYRESGQWINPPN